MKEMKGRNGITLIALIITIIVMLILVGISITIAIKGNLFGITKEAAKQTTIEAYRENLEAIRVNAMMEQIKNELTTAEFMDKVEEGIRANSVFNGGKIKKTNTSVKLITKEGYLFKITESKVVYMGMADEQGELTMDLSDKNTKFILDPEGWTKNAVKVSIEIRVDAEELGAVLQYSVDGENTWQEYKEPITVAEYGKVIKARLWNEEEGEEGNPAEWKVTNIDRLNPKQFVPTGTSTENSITLTGSTTDSEEETNVSGSSGIKAYYYSIDDGATWEPANGTKEGSYTFNNLEDNKTYSTLKMKAVDWAENEVVTNAIEVVTKKIPKLEVGDYVDYQPDTPVNGEYVVDGKYSGWTADQPITQDTLKWQVLKIHKNGSIDLIGEATSDSIYFRGAVGYNNGVYLMHDICEKLYSKPSQGITARSVSLEDFEDEDNGGNWKAERDAYIFNGVQYGKTETYTGSYSYYPNLYAEENGSGINTTAVKTNGIKDTNKYYTTPTTENYSQASTSGLTVTQTCYNIEINEANYGKSAKVLSDSNTYWLASRCVDTGRDFAAFALRSARYELDAEAMYYGRQQELPSGRRLRPIVTLQSDVELKLTEDGTNSRTNPHKIIKY